MTPDYTAYATGAYLFIGCMLTLRWLMIVGLPPLVEPGKRFVDATALAVLITVVALMILCWPVFALLYTFRRPKRAEPF